MRICLVENQDDESFQILKAQKDCLLFNYTPNVNTKSKYCAYLVYKCISITLFAFTQSA